MRLSWSIALGIALLVSPAMAAGDLLYQMEWQQVDGFSTLVRVNRQNPDGSVTVFDEVRRTNTSAGVGVLRLAPLPLLPEPDRTWYDASLDGVSFANVALGASPAIEPQCLHPLCVGVVSAEGDPARPARLGLSFADTDSPHCLFNCLSREFSGLAVLAAPEPAMSAWVAALGLGLGAAFLRRRRR
ncbi:MAG: hypothetical protein ACREM3_25930 [Candidatus Rokuibacteriota bacterium]